MKYNMERIKEIVSESGCSEMNIRYFWGHTPHPGKMTNACFSQWYDCWFVIEGVSYHTTEQFMMASKARLFSDEDTLQLIMSAETPFEYKKLGRKVKGFEQDRWNRMKYGIVVEGNKAKFGQNPVLKQYLLSTGDDLIAEASPYDTVWGIGLDREQALKGGIEQWKGENLLGFALMEVRDWLKE